MLFVFTLIYINLKDVFALFVILFMWSFQVRSLVIVTPRYFALFVDLSTWLCSVYWKMIDFCFLDMWIISYLSGLNDISHSSSHFSSLCRSDWTVLFVTIC